MDGFFRVHQTHYEQFGKLTGAVNIAEYGQVELNVTGMRDHSYGMLSIKAWVIVHNYYHKLNNYM